MSTIAWREPPKAARVTSDICISLLLSRQISVGSGMGPDQDHDVKNNTPSLVSKSTLFPAIYTTTCPPGVSPLSYGWTAPNARGQ